MIDLFTHIWLEIIITMCVKFYLPIALYGQGLAKAYLLIGDCPPPHSHLGLPPEPPLLCVANPCLLLHPQEPSSGSW